MCDEKVTARHVKHTSERQLWSGLPCVALIRSQKERRITKKGRREQEIGEDGAKEK